ncbi:2-octaprenyl-3-methyl-6-methoxy-1,4-benzoquinol hydroxylase [Dechloromonas denitrificans]|uniref:3-demethoxyubiquinol 3-hydroxylase n=1 Tax=Dechloromonas denitrificans TaxID=281362 RepID=A0A133XLA4_9RHOO|nr:2-polyprenyl-3-methyl-6-methoxy-1,4-benzoquinone monooxygenase [Dechloromonas denitrificans]KXB31723.1 2-octaprenyl-3-methyl-6-methoxy-1,4-benzoquinol hydroxylase [Dechloromonas denitrificans]
MAIDQVISEVDRVLRTLWAPASSVRPLPGAELSDAELSAAERSHVVGLMRVNHCGEICAQALYQGQALTSREPGVREALCIAANEETEHLAWTERRIGELGGQKSLLNPVLYAGALSMGVAAGLLGDKWNLGFLAETERQVEAHLDTHLLSLPAGDQRSRAIVEQMRLDEIRHADMAIHYGAAELPPLVKITMKVAAKIMTKAAYYL